MNGDTSDPGWDAAWEGPGRHEPSFGRDEGYWPPIEPLPAPPRTGGLRPLNVGDVLDGMFRLLIDHWRTYLLALGVLLVPVNLVTTYLNQRVTGSQGLLELFGNPAAVETFEAQVPTMGEFFASVGVSSAVAVFVSPLITGVATAIAADGHQGGDPQTGPVIRWALGRYWALVGATLALYLMPVLLFVPAGVLIALAAVTQAVPLVVVAVLLALATVVAVVAVWVLLVLAIPAIIVERVGPLAGLARSWRLVRRRFWAVFGTMLLVLIISAVVGAVLGAPASLLGALFGNVLGYVLIAVAATVIGLLTTPLAANAQTLLYFDARVRVEGLDLQMMTAELESEQR